MPNKSTLNDNYDIDHNKSGTSLSLKRKSKRDNIQSCYVRIRFKSIINTEGYCYSIMLNTNLMHNHPPDKSKTKEVIIYIYITFIL
jgi:hypothetical protein